MKKLALVLGLILLTTPVFASAVLSKKIIQVDNDALKADKPTWTGVKYKGLPVLFGKDATATNINYLSQIVITNYTDGTGRVSIQSEHLGAIAYNASFDNYNTRGSNVVANVLVAEFQDSGVVIATKLFKDAGFDPLRTTSTGGVWIADGIITTNYTLSATELAVFKDLLGSWSGLSVLPTRFTAGIQQYYKK